MAKRFTDTAIHGKTWHRKLPPRIKCLWQWLKDNCDHAGVVEFDCELASFQIGEEVNWDSLDFFGDRIERLSDSKIWLTGFIEFQYSKLKEGYNPHKPVFTSLDKHDLISRVENLILRIPEALEEDSQGLPGDAASLMDKDKDKDKNKAQDKEEDQEKEKEEEKDNVTFDKLVNAFNRILAGKGKVEHAVEYLPNDKDSIEEFKRILKHPKLKTMREWEEFFTMISKNRILTGDQNSEDWAISFSWLLNTKNINKVFDGTVGRSFGRSRPGTAQAKQNSMLDKYRKAMGGVA